MGNNKILAYGIALFLISFLLSFSGLAGLGDLSVKLNEDDHFLYKPDFGKSYDTELALIYIGSSSCRYANDPLLYETVDKLKWHLQQETGSRNLGFTAIGIAVDWRIVNGISHLNHLGSFDEVIVGNNWFNEGILKYVGALGDEASTPQIIMVFREYEMDQGHIAIEKGVVNESLLLRLRGVQEIMEWYHRGVPLPDSFLEHGRINPG